MDANWPGVTDTDALNARHVENVDLLADAAKAGKWDETFRLIESDHWLSANHWRITGRSWFAPLHQAAWLGAPVEVVEELIRRGAWRSLRNADGDRPVEVAQQQGHAHLIEALTVHVPSEREQQRYAAWDSHLARLIAERTERINTVEMRQIPTEIIALEQLETLYFGYPGMYGGFSISVHKERLFVESWSRVVGGSGQAHVITESGCVLVEEGFV